MSAPVWPANVMLWCPRTRKGKYTLWLRWHRADLLKAKVPKFSGFRLTVTPMGELRLVGLESGGLKLRLSECGTERYTILDLHNDDVHRLPNFFQLPGSAIPWALARVSRGFIETFPWPQLLRLENPYPSEKKPKKG